MEVFDAIRTMLAVRSYEDREIPEQVVLRILEAGRLTGSAMNRQEWDFVLIEEHDTLERIGKLASTGGYIADAPLAIAVLVPEDKYGAIDGARASQDMMLAAWGEGVGSNWVGNVDNEGIRSILEVPEGRVVLNIMPFGYPNRVLGKGMKDRKPLKRIAHAGKFGVTITS